MEDTLFQSSALSLEEKIRLPSETFFIPNTYRDASVEQQVRQKVTGASSVVIADGDFDGLAAAAAHIDVFPESVYVSAGPHGGEVDTDTALGAVADLAQDDVTVTVADISLNSAEDAASLVELSEKASDIYWCDHHPWNSSDAMEFVSEHVTRFEHDDAQDETNDEGIVVEEKARCGAQITADVLAERYSHSYSDLFLEGLHAVAARDLWRKDADGDYINPATAELNAFATAVAWGAESPYNNTSYMDFITPFIDYGVEVLSLPSVKRKVKSHRNKTDAQIAQVFSDFEDLSLTDTIELNGQDVETAIVYGRYPTSDVSDELRREFGFDLVITLTPTGGVSFRGSESFTHCNDIAYQFDGGGHPQAAGGSITGEFESILDYTEYWSTDGRVQRQKVHETLVNMTPDQFEG